MYAIPSFDTGLPRAPFEAARDAAAAWRGRCLDVYARSEAAVSETLLVLAADRQRGALVKLLHLAGQRYDVLLKATGPGGAFAQEGKAAADAIGQFQQHDALRIRLAHGVFTVTVDHRGHWHMVARVLAFRTNKEVRDLFVTRQDEAAELLDVLEKDGSRLRSTLGQLRKALRPA